MSDIYNYQKMVTQLDRGNILFGIFFMKSTNKPTLIEVDHNDENVGISLNFPKFNYVDNGYAEIEDIEWFETEIDRYSYFNKLSNK
tara:strand:+ start:4 stop:261 length:258 start_codon:yes stop_codon:yes gene_type:complete